MENPESLYDYGIRLIKQNWTDASTPRTKTTRDVLRGFEGHSAVYREGSILAHVKLFNIDANDKNVRADVQLIKNLVPFCSSTPSATWFIFSTWESFDFSKTYWA